MARTTSINDNAAVSSTTANHHRTLLHEVTRRPLQSSTDTRENDRIRGAVAEDDDRHSAPVRLWKHSPERLGLRVKFRSYFCNNQFVDLAGSSKMHECFGFCACVRSLERLRRPSATMLALPGCKKPEMMLVTNVHQPVLPKNLRGRAVTVSAAKWGKYMKRRDVVALGFLMIAGAGSANATLMSSVSNGGGFSWRLLNYFDYRHTSNQL